MPKVIVVKRRRRKENFDERKVYASVYSACMSKYANQLKCEKTAGQITENVKKWLKNKKTIDSSRIRKRIRSELREIAKGLIYHYDKNIPNLSRL